MKEHSDKEALHIKRMALDIAMCDRAGWRLAAGRVARNAEGLNLTALLDSIAVELGNAE
ncbi:MAG: hypothetical protein WAO83_21345 [Fuerstiella sp.]